MLKFNAVVKRWANFYFFVQNLAQWHASNHQSYNELWLRELGPLGGSERAALRRFCAVHRRYPFGPRYLGRPFFVNRDPWPTLARVLAAPDFAVVRVTFELHAGKFNRLYARERPRLERWQRSLPSLLNAPAANRGIVLTLNRLYRTSIRRRSIAVHLLLSAPEHCGGGANVDSRTVTAELSRLPLAQAARAAGIVWHETIHLCFDKAHFHPLLRRRYPKREQAWSLVTEAAASSLFPRGLLGVRCFGAPPAAQLTRRIPVRHTAALLNLTSEYMDEYKPFDRRYAEAVLSITKKYPTSGYRDNIFSGICFASQRAPQAVIGQL